VVYRQYFGFRFSCFNKTISKQSLHTVKIFHFPAAHANKIQAPNEEDLTKGRPLGFAYDFGVIVAMLSLCSWSVRLRDEFTACTP
jgi:hypothetical protein